MRTIFKLSENHISQLHELYQQEWWTDKRTIDETRNVVKGSQITIGLVDSEDALLGFARVLTDYTIKALIFDLIVRRDRRAGGLGDRLVSLIKKHEKLSAVKHFELYCRPEMLTFYHRHEFSTDVESVQLMRWVNPQSP